MPDTQVICITPVRNEEWILDRFLRAAAKWADHIVVADQRSVDATREIAAAHPKVRLIDNDAPAYDEGARQRLLLAAAREVPGRRLIVALDADEALAAGSWDGAEWEAAKAAEPGTVFAFEWINLLPDGKTAYVPDEMVPFAFLDGGAEHAGRTIHSTRVPVPAGAPIHEMSATKVLHLQYTDWPRMRSKQRWYQAWERINHPDKRPVQIFRQYNRMLAFPSDEVKPVDPAWLAAYEADGVRLTEHPPNQVYWWDREVLGWLLEKGPGFFRRVALWDIDWEQVARHADIEVQPGSLADPRSPAERAVHRWLERTQQRGSQGPASRWLQRLLIPFGW